ncbi:hypothetical protein J4Q44_G00328130 [Coregonus suidteri]|uniref:PIH1D1/2/3 CS-like domain-containing protein n=1 Tax=Coregonus suidteri TaxID=861788 RepID=A0AAN8KXL4_9TELE
MACVWPSSSKLKGSLEDMQYRLSSLKQSSTATNTASQTPASLLQQISSLCEGQTEDMAADPRDLSWSLELTVELPNVQSITECHLNISQDYVLLEVEDMYHLHLELPETVNEESASATFNKKKRTLTCKCLYSSAGTADTKSTQVNSKTNKKKNTVSVLARHTYTQ